jgi:hypothetical protein
VIDEVVDEAVDEMVDEVVDEAVEPTWGSKRSFIEHGGQGGRRGG